MKFEVRTRERLFLSEFDFLYPYASHTKTKKKIRILTKNKTVYQT